MAAPLPPAVTCVDCGDLIPRPVKWISLKTCGVFCNCCCSAHRSLGTDIVLLPSEGTIQMVLDMAGDMRDAFWESNKGGNTSTSSLNAAGAPAADTAKAKAKAKAGGGGGGGGGARRRTTAPASAESPSAQDNSAVKLQFIIAKYKDGAFLPAAYTNATTAERNRGLQNCVLAGDHGGAWKWLCAGAKADTANPVGAGVGPPLLHLAASLGDVAMVQLLLAHGANPSARDQNGAAADKLARQIGNHTVAVTISQAQTEIVRMFQWHLKTAIIEPLLETEQSSLDNAARPMLSKLPQGELEGMLRDVYDELQRRWLGKLWRGSGADLNDEIPVPFLPIVMVLPAVRQQSRQKLATLKQKLFSRLVQDLLDEVVVRRMVHVEVAKEPPPRNAKDKAGKKKRTAPTSTAAAAAAVGGSGSGGADFATTGLLHRVADALVASGSSRYSPPKGAAGAADAAAAGGAAAVATDLTGEAVTPGRTTGTTNSSPAAAVATAAELRSQQQQRQDNLEQLSNELVEALESKVISLEDEVRHLKRENSRLRARATDRELLIEDLQQGLGPHAHPHPQPHPHSQPQPQHEHHNMSIGSGVVARNTAGISSIAGGGPSSSFTAADWRRIGQPPRTAAGVASVSGGGSSKPKLSAAMESSTLALHGVFTAVSDGHPDRIAESITGIIPPITKLCDRFVESASRIKQGLAGRLLSKLEELLRFDPAYDVDAIEECAYEMAKAVKVLVSS